MEVIYYFLLLMIVIAIVSFSVWAWYYALGLIALILIMVFGFTSWYCHIRQTIAITKKIEELNVEKMTFADLLASKKLIGDDNDKNEF